MRLYKYSNQTVLKEADLLLSGHTLNQISEILKIPISTVSWHLIKPLFFLDYSKWVEVRKRLNKFAKSELRVYTEYLFVKSVEAGEARPIRKEVNF